MAAWAEVDMGSAFAPDVSIGSPPPEEGVRSWIDHVPTALVFLPILITWSGLALAAGAYGRSRDDAALEGLSFLERWQDGFNGALPTMLAFDNVALFTLLGIIVLIVSVVGQSIHRRRADARAECEGAELARRLTSAMTGVQFTLGEARLGNPDRVADRIGEAIGHVREVNRLAQRTQQETLNALSETRENLRAAQSAVTVLEGSSKTVAEAIREGGELARELQERLGEVASAIERIAEASTGLTASSAREGSLMREGVDGAMSRFTEEVREVLGEWQDTNAGFAHRFEQAGDLSGRVAESMNTLPRAVERLGSEIDALREQWTVTERLVVEQHRAQEERQAEALERLVEAAPEDGDQPAGASRDEEAISGRQSGQTVLDLEIEPVSENGSGERGTSTDSDEDLVSR
ncbi:hypothetical protein [Nocardiopsis valliformis]|uniref:hypothetical protein n=1 Tax=Nocardiopsis valliformis TaxID=239974 RepID=UPI000372B093|nr:hypothetical protein [Nocardiopsis valliformis]